MHGPLVRPVPESLRRQETPATAQTLHTSECETITRQPSQAAMTSSGAHTGNVAPAMAVAATRLACRSETSTASASARAIRSQGAEAHRARSGPINAH